MKRRILFAVLAVAALGLGITPSEGSDAEPAIVFYVNIEPKKGGQVLCALYRDEDTWLSHNPYRSARTGSDRAVARCRFPRVPAGDYAIAALHDEDSDGAMDDFLGLPLEGYAASRNAHLKGIGAPDWEDAIFGHHTELTVQRARMKY